MTWFKVDDHLAFHSKVVEAGNAAMGLWVRAGSWAAAQLTDGFVPNRIVILLAEGDADQIDALVAANLWVPRDGGYQFHDWGDQQPSSHDVKERRRRDAERKAEWRDRKKTQASGGATPASGGTDDDVPAMSQRDTSPGRSNTDLGGEGHTEQLSQRDSALPDPTRPDPGSVATHPGDEESPGEGGAGGSEPSRKRSSRPRGTRLPDDWEPDEDLKQWVRDNCTNLTNRQKRVQTQDFCDYWHAKPGRDAEKINWNLTYQRWMRKNNEEAAAPGRPGRGGVASRSTVEERHATLDAFRRPEQPQLPVADDHGDP